MLFRGPIPRSYGGMFYKPIRCAPAFNIAREGRSCIRKSSCRPFRLRLFPPQNGAANGIRTMKEPGHNHLTRSACASPPMRLL